MELLCVFASMAALFLFCAFLTLRCGLHSALAPLTALSAAVLWLTLWGMAGPLLAGAWILFAAFAALGIWALWPCKGARPAYAKLASPGAILFWGMTAAFAVYFFLRQPMATGFDELNLWATAVKVTKVDNSLYSTATLGTPWAVTQNPGLPLLSEEGRHQPYDERRPWGRLWVVDPLDGTKEFLKRNGEFTVNIALVDEGRPVAGVVYVPATATLYFGAEGLGAYRLADYRDEATPAWAELTDAARRLPLAEGRTDYVVVVSRSHLSAETEAFIDEARRAHADVRTVPSGSSIKICLVAEGTADVYPRLAPTMEWDTAAGHAVVRAAGGDIVEAGNGATLRYNKRDLTNPYFIVRRDANAPQS